MYEVDETIPLPKDEQPDVQATNNSLITSYLNGTIRVIVPVPSIEKLQAISEQCITNPDTEAALGPQIAVNQLDTFTAQVEALSSGDNPSIPPGCAADLIAVAEALEAK